MASPAQCQITSTNDGHGRPNRCDKQCQCPQNAHYFINISLAIVVLLLRRTPRTSLRMSIVKPSAEVLHPVYLILLSSLPARVFR